MAQRDIFRLAEKAAGKVPDRYDISAEEVRDIYYSMTRLDSIITAFRAGFVLGARAQKAGKFNEFGENMK